MILKDYLLEKPILETERLILRTMNINDAKDLTEWLPDPDLYTYWGRPARDHELNPEKLYLKIRTKSQAKPNKDFHWGMVLNKLIK